jgi:ATP-binding cassette subfamily B protein
LGLFFADMACAFIVSATTLILPLCARYITKNVLVGSAPNALSQIYAMGAVMLGLVLVHTACNMFVDYQGHMMGALMERDIRGELFEHLQKLSFSFYDEQRTGQLMTLRTIRLTWRSCIIVQGYRDLVAELYQGVVIWLVSTSVSVDRAAPIMAAYVFCFNKRMNVALRRAGIESDINAQVEDTLAGIRVVKSFTNDEIERKKFAYENNRFLDSRRDGYKNEAYFSAGMIGFTQLMTISLVIFGVV